MKIAKVQFKVNTVRKLRQSSMIIAFESPIGLNHFKQTAITYLTRRGLSETKSEMQFGISNVI